MYVLYGLWPMAMYVQTSTSNCIWVVLPNKNDCQFLQRETQLWFSLPIRWTGA